MLETNSVIKVKKNTKFLIKQMTFKNQTKHTTILYKSMMGHHILVEKKNKFFTDLCTSL